MLETIGVAREALPLVAELFQLIQAGKGDENESLRTVIVELEIKAIKLADELMKGIGGLLEEFASLGVDIESSEQEAFAEFRAEASLVKKIRLNNLISTLKALRNQLGTFVMDVEVVFTCANKGHLIAETTVSPQNLRIALYKMPVEDISIKEQLDFMMNAAGQYSAVSVSSGGGVLNT